MARNVGCKLLIHLIVIAISCYAISYLILFRKTHDIIKKVKVTDNQELTIRGNIEHVHEKELTVNVTKNLDMIDDRKSIIKATANTNTLLHKNQSSINWITPDMEYKAQFDYFLQWENRSKTGNSPAESHEVKNKSLVQEQYRFDALDNGLILISDSAHTDGGSAFYVLQYFGKDYSLVASCTVTDHFNGNYTVRCPWNSGSQCTKVRVTLQYENFDAYRDRVAMLGMELWTARVCASSLTKHTQPDVYWQLAADGRCKRLHYTRGTSEEPEMEQICRVVHGYDALYIIGVSHVRFLADFLFVHCLHLNMTAYPIKYGDLAYGKVHFYFWQFIDTLVKNTETVESWLHAAARSNQSIAVWIEYADWDLYIRGYKQTATENMEKLVGVIELIKNFKDTHDGVSVDLQVLGQAISPDDQLTRSMFAAGVYNAKLKERMKSSGVPFTDIFNLEFPCKNSVATPSHEQRSRKNFNQTNWRNGNHYFQRVAYGNEFFGDVGFYVYLDFFLQSIIMRK